ncbi:MAG: hydrogenase maturation nickel metallochaperone HypA [Thermoanaerobaculia bacterium]|nr:hydrogenase maturation nickel metallochaperone HypA [Thermoanaerobaculia bacterium]
MHELSIIYSILETAEQEVQRHGEDSMVETIELEIGELAGVEISSLEFLWPAAVAGTILEKAVCNIIRPPGKASCGSCGHVFGIKQYFDPCPQCGSHWNEIINGEELRIKSLTITCAQPAVAVATDTN